MHKSMAADGGGVGFVAPGGCCFMVAVDCRAAVEEARNDSSVVTRGLLISLAPLLALLPRSLLSTRQNDVTLPASPEPSTVR